jgi:ATP-dependent helicase/nuclease subunit B
VGGRPAEGMAPAHLGPCVSGAAYPRCPVSALVLVPSPLQASRAARRLCDAQGGILFGPQVATIDALVTGLLAAAGDGRPVLTPLAERLLAHAAGREAGGPFRAVEPASGLAEALATALGELRRGEVTARAARAAAATLEGAPAARLGALAAALEALEGRLESGGLLDRTAAIRAAAEAVRRGAPLGEAGELDLLVVDGFAGFGPAEWDLMAALVARARRSRFDVPAFPERPDLSAAAEPYLRRVEGLHALTARREVEVALTHLGEGRAPWPAALLAAFAGGVAEPPPGQGGAAGEVLALVGEGEDGEAALAARTAARLVAAGLDPGDLLVLHPAPGPAAARLAAAFAAEGLPFASGRGRPLGEAPPVRAALDALAAASGGLDRRSAERLAASSYLAVGAPSRLGRLLDRAGALDGRTAPEAALRHRAAALTGTDSPRVARERAALLRAADGLAALAAAVRPLSGRGTPDAQATRLAGWLDASGLRRRAGRADVPLAARDLAAVARLEQAADDLARALRLAGRGDERLDAASWGELLGLAVARASLPASGEPAAGAVELWGLDEAPGRAARAALVLGCARGAFPAAPAPEPLLREPERQAVNASLGRGALATAGTRRAEALHRAACAVAAGREVVALGWPGEGPSGGGAPAPLATEALRALGLEPGGSPGAAPLSAARTPAEALAAVARLASRAGEAAAGPALACLPQALAGRARSALARGAVEAERRQAVLAGRATPHAGLIAGEALAVLQARLPAEWSPSHLEAHARCPFRFFAAVGLGLGDPESTGLDIDGRDEGSLLHAVLERWVAARVARRAWPPDGGAADRAEARAVAGALFTRFEAEGRTGDPAVWAARREAVLARLDRIVAAEAAEAGGLTPALLEFAFGEGSPRPPLVLRAGGAAVRVKGRIDRVDASPDRLLVIDYKNARQATRYRPLLEPEAFGVDSFQVPLYLLAAARELPGRAPAATFQLLRSAERLAPVAGAPDEAALANAVVATVGRIRAGELPIRSRGCEGCPFGAVCRFQGVAEVGEGGEGAP